MPPSTNSLARDKILALLKKDPVAFVGAGLSKPHYKDWRGLIEQISDIMKVAVTAEIHPIKQAEELRLANESKYKNALIHIYGKYPPNCSETLKRLVRCGFKSYVTTNYDCSIELAFHNNHRPIPRRISYPELPEVYLEGESIHHIHGTIDPKKPEASQLILDETSYIQAYTDERLLTSYIFSLFTRQNILFTGYSLNDSEPINGIIEVVEKEIKGFQYISKKPLERKNWACLFPLPVDPAKAERLSKIGIEIIEYDPIDDSHSGLTSLWTEISEEHTPVPPESLAPIFKPFEN